MNNNFDRLLKLAQKTKSTLVVYDQAGDNHCVVLGIEQFEQIIDSKPSAVSKPSTPIQSEKIIETAPAVIDSDLAADQAVLEALNQKISEWRASQPAVEPEIPEEPLVLKNEIVVEPPLQTESPVAAPVLEPSKSSSWHRLGDVMATNLKPKMPEVRYEEIGELEAPLPIANAEETEDFSEPESLDDEPLFLEEPVS